MLRYSISCANPNSHFLQISLSLQVESVDAITLVLPSWRPGRYEIADYAKNLRKLRAFNGDRELNVEKTTKNKWIVDTTNCSAITISYEYFAFEMTAGTSWVDDAQWYINFINCMLYAEGISQEPVEVTLNIPANYIVGCALSFENGKLTAKDYQELVDSPLFASDGLQHFGFEQAGTVFHLWVQGDVMFSMEDFVEDIKKYTTPQVALFKGFPTREYHYLFQFLPYNYYHGVEHKNSTVITIGPAADLVKRELYKELLGVSSHELFHAWNVTRIRPKELLPYDFSKEVYYKTGLITEGLTTYYGDLMLFRGGVFSEEEYLLELNKMLQRHLQNTGRHFYSLVESSHDLWLDGYKPSAPGRKVSIYIKGAIIAWILDLKLQQKGASLDDVMIELWQHFGDQKRGYTLDDYYKIIHQYLGKETDSYFEKYVYGTVPIEDELTSLIHITPYKLTDEPNENPIERHLGFKLDKENKIILIDETSDAFKKLSMKDEVISINSSSPQAFISPSGSTIIEVNRFGRHLTFELSPGDHMKQLVLVN